MSVSRKCFRCILFSMPDEGTELTKNLNFARNYPLMEREGEDWQMQQCVLRYVQVHWVENGWIFFSFFPAHAQYINIMYILDLTLQKSDVWIGVAILLDNATRPVERAAEMRHGQFRHRIFNEFNSTRQKCDRAYVLRILGNVNNGNCIEEICWGIVNFEGKCFFQLAASSSSFLKLRSVTVSHSCLFLTDRKFGGEKNSKGFHVLPPYLRIIQVSKEDYSIFHTCINSLKAQLYDIIVRVLGWWHKLWNPVWNSREHEETQMECR